MEWYVPVDIDSDASGSHRRLYRVDLAAAAGDVTITLLNGVTPNDTAHYIGAVIMGAPSGRKVLLRAEEGQHVAQLQYEGQAVWVAWNGAGWDVVAEAGPEYGPAVANIAALASIDDELLQSGARVRALSVLDDFELLKTSTLPLEPMQVIATQSGNGRWVRCLHGDVGAWLGESEWRIDNATGNDENSGRNAAPLATWAELLRRWGGIDAYHTSSKVVRITSLSATDALDFNFGTAPGVIVDIRGDLTTVYSGSVVSKTDLSEVAPGTANACVASWTTAQLGRLTRDITNNRWCFPEFDLGAAGSDRNLECSPWTNIDTTNGSMTVTTGNTTVAALLETYTVPVVAAQSTCKVQNSKTGQTIGVILQQLEFTGQRTCFSGMKLCVQNCRLGSIRFQEGPIALNNTYNSNGAPWDTSASAGLVVLNAGVWANGLGNNSNGSVCTFDVRSNCIWLGQVQVTRKGIFRLRNMFIMRIGGGACFVTRDNGLVYLTATSSLCGTGNSGNAFFCVGTSGVQIENGTALGTCKLSATGITFNGTNTCNAYDPSTGLYSTPRALTLANIDATYVAGGFGGAALDPKFGSFFQCNPVA